jgi:hypothetical protein
MALPPFPGYHTTGQTAEQAGHPTDFPLFFINTSHFDIPKRNVRHCILYHFLLQ